MLIEAKELLKYYKNKKWKKNIVIFDASWYLPNQNRNPYEEFKIKHIPKSIFFDIDEISNKDTTLPHMVPTISQFNKKMNEMGISNNDKIIIYSMDGIGTSPRVWWMFKLFGHKNVSVLNGGFRAWSNSSGPINDSHQNSTKSSKYYATYNKNLICNYKDILKTIDNKKYQIIDARSKERFDGIEEEPRAGLKKGHIPNSINLPFTKLINNKGYLISKSKIINLLKTYSINKNIPIISTCGSGVTACTLALALNHIGIKNWKIYDGSWSDSGSKKKSLIEIELFLISSLHIHKYIFIKTFFRFTS